MRNVYKVTEQLTSEKIKEQVDIEVRAGKLDPSTIIKSNLTDEEIKTKAKEAGFSTFWTGSVGETEMNEFFDSEKGKELAKQLYIKLLEDQYRAAGMLK